MVRHENLPSLWFQRLYSLIETHKTIARLKPSQLVDAHKVAVIGIHMGVYALSRWEGLSRFLEDGRVDLDSNAVERSIRPLAISRKNALFAGSDEGDDNWTVIATLIENCKLSGVNPHDWLTRTRTKLANGHPASDLVSLMSWTAVV